MRSRSATAVAVSALMLVAAPALAAGASPQPPHTRVVVGTQPSTLHDDITIEAGSSHWLVYQDSRSYTSDLGEDAGPKPRRLLVRSKRGSVHALPAGGGSLLSVSLSGDWLAATNRDRSTYHRAYVQWWHLGTAAHGHLVLPGRGSLLSAAPRGVTTMTRNGVIHLITTAGTRHRLARPFRKEPPEYYEHVDTQDITGADFTAVDDRGMVLGTGEGGVRYFEFRHPSHVRTLQSGGSTLEFCRSLTHAYAGCLEGTLDDDGVGDDAVTLVPLDGSAPTRYDTTTTPGVYVSNVRVAVSGDRLVWTASEYGVGESYSINDLEAGGTVPERASHDGYGYADPTSAFGEVAASYFRVQQTPNGSEADDDVRVQAVKDVNHISDLFAVHRSPATASALALAPGRVVDIDDARISDEGSLLAERSRDVRVTGRHVTSRGSTVIKASQVDDQGVTAGPGVTTYLSGSPEHLHAVRPQGDIDLGAIMESKGLAVSGNRVLDVSVANPSPLVVHDLVTGATSTVVPDADQVTGATIWGHTVAYMRVDGAVFSLNLNTDRRRHLATSPHSGGFGGSAGLAVYGNHVAWATVTKRGEVLRSVIGKVSGHGKPIGLHGMVLGLGPEGALLASQFQFTYFGRATTRVTIRLRRWSGKTSVLLSKRRYHELPQLVGHALAWVGMDGFLRVAPHHGDLPAPRSLGDPDAPASLSTGGGDTWRLTAPYTLPLTACTVTIARGGATVRHLDCATKSARQGLTDVTWNGTNDHGAAVPAGTYRWTVHARGEGGAAETESGAHRALSGDVTVTS